MRNYLFISVVYFKELVQFIYLIFITIGRGDLATNPYSLYLFSSTNKGLNLTILSDFHLHFEQASASSLFPLGKEIHNFKLSTRQQNRFHVPKLYNRNKHYTQNVIYICPCIVYRVAIFPKRTPRLVFKNNKSFLIFLPHCHYIVYFCLEFLLSYLNNEKDLDFPIFLFLDQEKMTILPRKENSLILPLCRIPVFLPH